VEADRIVYKVSDTAMRESKNRKTPGIVNLSKEFFTYGPKEAKYIFLDTLNQCWLQIKILKEWKELLLYQSSKKEREIYVKTIQV
jgi:hypothetical protein